MLGVLEYIPMRKHPLLGFLAVLFVLMNALAWTIGEAPAMLGSMFLSMAYLALSLAAFVLWGIDKRRAIQGRWRIRERTLLGLVLCGGALGGYAGMTLFRHKTREKAFLAALYGGLIFHGAALAALLIYAR
jgi:uncharacterized membrane protein YsdA (DUF1294 family)